MAHPKQHRAASIGKAGPSRPAGGESAFARCLCSVALLASACAPLTLVAQPALALDTGSAAQAAGWLGGLSLARVRNNGGDVGLRLPGEMSSVLSKIEANAGSRFFGGYRFSPNFMLGGTVTDFSKFDALRDTAAPALLVTGQSSGFRMDAVGVVPLLGGFSLFGKFGTLYAPSRYSLASGGAFPTTPGVPGQKFYGWNATYGLGASYDVSESTGLHLKYERAGNYFGDARTGDSNPGIWSFGLIRRY